MTHTDDQLRNLTRVREDVANEREQAHASGKNQGYFLGAGRGLLIGAASYAAAQHFFSEYPIATSIAVTAEAMIAMFWNYTGRISRHISPDEHFAGTVRSDSMNQLEKSIIIAETVQPTKPATPPTIELKGYLRPGALKTGFEGVDCIDDAFAAQDETPAQPFDFDRPTIVVRGGEQEQAPSRYLPFDPTKISLDHEPGYVNELSTRFVPFDPNETRTWFAPENDFELENARLTYENHNLATANQSLNKQNVILEQVANEVAQERNDARNEIIQLYRPSNAKNWTAIGLLAGAFGIGMYALRTLDPIAVATAFGVAGAGLGIGITRPGKEKTPTSVQEESSFAERHRHVRDSYVWNHHDDHAAVGPSSTVSENLERSTYVVWNEKQKEQHVPSLRPITLEPHCRTDKNHEKVIDLNEML